MNKFKELHSKKAGGGYPGSAPISSSSNPYSQQTQTPSNFYQQSSGKLFYFLLFRQSLHKLHYKINCFYLIAFIWQCPKYLDFFSRKVIFWQLINSNKTNVVVLYERNDLIIAFENIIFQKKNIFWIFYCLCTMIFSHTFY